MRIGPPRDCSVPHRILVEHVHCRFAHIARPIFKLLLKDKPFVWSTVCEEAFNFLKDALCSSPVLARYNPRFEVVLDTDYQQNAISASVGMRDPKYRREDSNSSPAAEHASFGLWSDIVDDVSNLPPAGFYDELNPVSLHAGRPFRLLDTFLLTLRVLFLTGSLLTLRVSFLARVLLTLCISFLTRFLLTLRFSFLSR